MKKILLIIGTILFAGISLIACVTNQTATKPETQVATNLDSNSTALGGSIENSMDKYDKEKVSHALDKPVGKTTEWVNESTGITYTVTPMKKLTYNGNPYCRQYKIISSRNDKNNEMTGTACVSSKDSTWRLVS